MIEIVGFNKKYSEQFFILNKAWIEESWHLEDSDKKDLLNPDKIVEDGGQIFFALENKIAIGTVAMIKSSDDKFELAKMTVQEDFRGKGISNMLMDECLKFAKQNNSREIFLIYIPNILLGGFCFRVKIVNTQLFVTLPKVIFSLEIRVNFERP